MTISRRATLKYLAVLLICMPIASLAKTSGLPEASLAQDPSGKVNLSISFSGPMAFVMDGDDVIVYAPKADHHSGVVRTSANDSHLRDNMDYELTGLPAPPAETVKVFPPAQFNIPGPYPQADEGRYFKIKLKRPDLIIGLRLVDVFLTGQDGMHPKASLPTGLRFIYKDVPSDIALQLTGTNNFTYTPSFAADEQAGMRRYDLAFDLMSMTMNDICHQDARSSFKKVVDLFPATNILSIQYDGEDPNCAMQASTGRLMDATLRLRGGDANSFNEANAENSRNSGDGPRLLLVGGGAADCQSIVIMVHNAPPAP